jgi:hypothetical protein
VLVRFDHVARFIVNADHGIIYVRTWPFHIHNLVNYRSLVTGRLSAGDAFAR